MSQPQTEEVANDSAHRPGPSVLPPAGVRGAVDCVPIMRLRADLGFRSLFTLRRSWIWLLLIVGLIYGCRLNRPETGRLEDGKWLYAYDENYTVLTARRIAVGDKNVWDAWRHPDDGADRRFTSIFSTADLGNDDSRYEWVHPPTPRVIMAAIIRVAGMNPALYRIPSVLLGLLIVGMVWVVGNRMRGPGFGLFAATLTAADGWLFCLSRVGMTDIYYISMTVAAYAAFYIYWTTPTRRIRWIAIVAAACGAALAMKWSALAPITGLVGLAVARIALDWRNSPATRAQTVREAAAALASFAVLPPLIYFASFWPFFAAGHSLDEWVKLHKAIIDYNMGAPASSPGSSRWYQWPLDRGSTWFLTRAENGSCQYTYASGNWLAWWPFVPAMCYAAEQFTSEPKFERAFVIVGGCATWLPYAMVHRFVYTRYFAATVPFSALAISMAIFDLDTYCRAWIEEMRAARSNGAPGHNDTMARLRAIASRIGRALRPTYIGAAVVFFALRYPLWAGVPLPCSSVQAKSFTEWRHAFR
ncbi:MAG: glycosyltransferase family 39 protein [Polyangiaceae bacterium]